MGGVGVSCCVTYGEVVFILLLVRDEVWGGGVGVWLFRQWGGHLCVTPCELKGAFFLVILVVER